MGQSEQLAQRTFAEETERTTAGAAGWQDPPEIRLDKVTSDGFLVIRRPHGLAHLPAPWPEAQPHDEVMIELKLAGNHLDREAVERALLRGRPGSCSGSRSRMRRGRDMSRSGSSPRTSPSG
jgi:hypothetical protein